MLTIIIIDHVLTRSKPTIIVANVYAVMNKLLLFLIDQLKIWYHLFAAFLGLFLPSRKKDVSKEIVLITGAGSGIGRALSLKFAKLGSTVILWDINKSAGDAVADEINSKSPNKAFSYKCDCSKREEVYRMAENVKKDIGDVTILVNNAGIVSGNRILNIPDDKINLTLRVNSIAHFWVSLICIVSRHLTL